MNEVDLGATAFWVLLGVGLVSGSLSLWAFEYLSDTGKLRSASNRVVAHLLEFQLFADEPALILKAQLDLLASNGRLLRLLAVPVLVMAIPWSVLLTTVDAFFGRAPLRADQATVVTVQCAGKPGSPLPLMRLEGQAGIKVETPPVRIPRERQISWRVRPVIETSGELRVTVDAHSALKTISSKPGLHWLSDRRTDLFSSFLHPLEWPLTDPVIKSVAIQYPVATVFQETWRMWFSIGSVSGALLFLLAKAKLPRWGFFLLGPVLLVPGRQAATVSPLFQRGYTMIHAPQRVTFGFQTGECILCRITSRRMT